jgi:hypothetical protein
LRANETIPTNIFAGIFSSLATSEIDESSALTWINADGSASFLCSLLGAQNVVAAKRNPIPFERSSGLKTSPTSMKIEHYLLLPLYEWGVADWHLEVIKPFVLKHHPTIGFSLAEAALAKVVTVIGGEQNFPEAKLNELRTLGCEVERISGDGTTIATQLSER